ncbi:MAG: hypothetical protein K2Q20_07860 [Phycisphaerales bacterium]|nr:hypothetical protein [Phycisphaerales bacterium]
MLRVCGEVLSVWSTVEVHGIAEARRRHGNEAGELTEACLEAVGVIAGELTRLEFEDEVRDALSAAAEREGG